MDINIKYTDNVVAFIDVLGFSKLVQKSVENDSDLERVNELVKLLGDAIPVLDRNVTAPKEAVPKHIYISDSIILCVKNFVEVNGKEYYGLNTIVMRCIQLTHLLTYAGYLVRGGIDIGKVWMSETNIVGPAYQKAYQLESQEAEYPRITLSAEASKQWEKYGEPKCFCMKSNDNKYYVNGLYPYEEYFANKSYFCENNYYQDILDIIDNNIKQLENNSKAKDKWEWFKENIFREGCK